MYIIQLSLVCAVVVGHVQFVYYAVVFVLQMYCNHSSFENIIKVCCLRCHRIAVCFEAFNQL